MPYFDTLRGAIGGALQQKLTDRTKSGRMALENQALTMALQQRQAKQAEAMFPLQVELLKKQIAGTLNPEQKYEYDLRIAKDEADLKMAQEAAIENLRQGNEMAQIGARRDAEIAVRKTPTYNVSEQIGGSSVGRQNRIVELAIDETGKPSDKMHKWTVDDAGIPLVHLGMADATPADPVMSAQEQARAWNMLLGRVDTKGKSVEAPSNEFVELKDLTKKLSPGYKNVKMGKDMEPTDREFAYWLISNGFPDNPQIQTALGMDAAQLEMQFPTITPAIKELRRAGASTVAATAPATSKPRTVTTSAGTFIWDDSRKVWVEDISAQSTGAGGEY